MPAATRPGHGRLPERPRSDAGTPVALPLHRPLALKPATLLGGVTARSEANFDRCVAALPAPSQPAAKPPP